MLSFHLLAFDLNGFWDFRACNSLKFGTQSHFRCVWRVSYPPADAGRRKLENLKTCLPKNSQSELLRSHNRLLK